MQKIYIKIKIYIHKTIILKIINVDILSFTYLQYFYDNDIFILINIIKTIISIIYTFILFIKV